MKTLTTLLLAAMAVACNDSEHEEPAPSAFKTTKFHVILDNYAIHTQTYATKKEYEDDLTNYSAWGPSSAAACNDTAIYNKISLDMLSWKDPNQLNHGIEFYFVKSFLTSQINKDSEYEFMDRLFSGRSFEFIQSSIYSPNEMKEIFNSPTSLVEIGLIDENGKIWSSREGTQEGSQFTVSDYSLNPFRGPSPTIYDYDFVLTGTFSCKLYQRDNPSLFKDIKEATFKVPIMNQKYHILKC